MEPITTCSINSYANIFVRPAEILMLHRGINMHKPATLLTLSLALFTATFSLAMQCPKAITNVTFQHQIVENAPAQPWMMDTNYISQGWYINRNSMLENSTLSTVPSSTPLRVIFIKTALSQTNNYRVYCEYRIKNPLPHSNLVVTNSNLYQAPNNSNYKNVSGTTFICKTTAGAPEMCYTDDVQTIVCGMGHNC
jgi:hypothetical protein